MIRKRTPILPKKTILIATADNAMVAYFSRVRKDCRYGNMTVQYIPADTLDELIKATGKARIAGKFASAWALFSLSEFNLKPADITAAQSLADSRKVKLGWVSPNLSLWLFLHLKALNVYVDSVSQLDQALAKVFPGYEPTAEYLTNEGQDIHLRLFSSFSKAVLNSGDYNKIAEKKTGVAATSFPLLYEDIKELCGEADLSHNQKLLAK
jgi:hypothetical protein